MPNKEPNHTHLYKCLGAVISSRRKKLGLSQEQLAEDADVDRAFISTIERGKRNPSFGTVAKIAGGLRMRYSRLVTNCELCTEKTGK
jgi:transcriptional regulator with XRE-family HTH domain